MYMRRFGSVGSEILGGLGWGDEDMEVEMVQGEVRSGFTRVAASMRAYLQLCR